MNSELLTENVKNAEGEPAVALTVAEKENLYNNVVLKRVPTMERKQFIKEKCPTIEDFTLVPEEEWLQVRGFGQGTVYRLEKALGMFLFDGGRLGNHCQFHFGDGFHPTAAAVGRIKALYINERFGDFCHRHGWKHPRERARYILDVYPTVDDLRNVTRDALRLGRVGEVAPSLFCQFLEEEYGIVLS